MGLLKMAWRRARKMLAWVLAFFMIAGFVLLTVFILTQLGWM